KLTPLGRMIVDSRQERGARADAFLKVPLYGAVYARYKDWALLPPDKTLEMEFVGLGVAEKQKDLARQTFARSAQQAGYFEHGKDRLIRPGVMAPVDSPPAEKPGDKGGGRGGGDDSDIDPIIRGLLVRLPKSGEVWPDRDRKLWLQLLE